MPADEFLPGAAALCRKYGSLFIADEIQTGIAAPENSSRRALERRTRHGAFAKALSADTCRSARC